MRSFFIALCVLQKTLRVDFWGQSNQVGAGGSSGQAPIPDGNHCKKYQINTQTLVAHVEPSGSNFGSFQSGSGLQSAFVKKLYELTNRDIICFKTAMGGTSALQWSTTLSTASLDYLAAAPSNIKDANIEPILVYFQGEADAVAINQSSETKAQYKSYVTTTINKWRAVNGATAKVFLIKVGYSTYAQDNGTDTVNLGLQELADSMTNVYIAFNASALDPTINKPIQDQQHFNQTGLNNIGVGAAILIASVL